MRRRRGPLLFQTVGGVGAAVTKERDELFGKAEQLTKERDEARGALERILDILGDPAGHVSDEETACMRIARAIFGRDGW